MSFLPSIYLCGLVRRQCIFCRACIYTRYLDSFDVTVTMVTMGSVFAVHYHIGLIGLRSLSSIFLYWFSSPFIPLDWRVFWAFVVVCDLNSLVFHGSPLSLCIWLVVTSVVSLLSIHVSGMFGVYVSRLLWYLLHSPWAFIASIDTSSDGTNLGMRLCTSIWRVIRTMLME